MGYVHRYCRVDSLWTVGYFDPKGQWNPLRDCRSQTEAEEWISYLNGGKCGSPDNRADIDVSDVPDFSPDDRIELPGFNVVPWAAIVDGVPPYDRTEASS